MDNQDPVDVFTAVHFVQGFILGAAGFRISTIAVMACVWELVEDGMKDAEPDLFPKAGHDSKENAVVDILAGVAGAIIAKHVVD